MADRSLGWVQNPSDFKKLKNVVEAFDYESDTYFFLVDHAIPDYVTDLQLKDEMLNVLAIRPLSVPYEILKGKGVSPGQSRRDAKCTGIIQAVLPNQSGRPYSDDWTTDGFIRWAISIGFLDYIKDKDEVTITETGLSLSRCLDISSRDEILTQAFLSYPPAIRILELLKDQKHLTKFELGKQLGGLGEPGFTSIPQELFVQALAKSSPEERQRLRSNVEGSADKYARMICTWLSKVGLVQRIGKEVSIILGAEKFTEEIGTSYRITLNGLQKLHSAKGLSSHSKIPKIVYWEMLATKSADRDYLRTRRALIIDSLIKKPRTLTEIRSYLSTNNKTETESTILDELQVIEAMGIKVHKSSNIYSITDNIDKLNIPTTTIIKTSVLEIKDRVRQKLQFTDHRFLSLIDLAFDSTSSRDFEYLTIELFKKLDYYAIRLGESRRPDGVISHKEKGVILDNKSYQNGYSLPISQADEMIRYVIENQQREKSLNQNEWWLSFPTNVSTFNYLFVTSFLKGNFESNLEYISQRTSVKGGAISAEHLLYLSELIMESKKSREEIFDLFDNKEIRIQI